MLDALEEGFKVTLYEDATRALDETAFEKMKSQIIEKGGRLKLAGELV